MRTDHPSSFAPIRPAAHLDIVMQLAPVSRKDLEPLAALVRESLPDMQHVDAAVLEEQSFGDPDHDISFLLQAVERNKPVGMVFGMARKSSQGKRGFLKVFAVHPKHRGKGIGGTLFSELERRFRKREVHEVHTGRCPAPYLISGVSVEDTDTVSFLMNRSYQPARTVIHMTADLGLLDMKESPEDGALAKECGLRAAKEEDLKLIQEFASEQAPGFAWEIKKAAQRGVLWVALAKKKVLGFAAAEGMAPGVFGPLAVAPDRRDSGLDRLLLWRVLGEMKKKKRESVLFSDVSAVPFYHKYAGASLGPFAFDLIKRV